MNFKTFSKRLTITTVFSFLFSLSFIDYTYSQSITLNNIPNDVTVECDAIPVISTSISATTTCSNPNVNISVAETTLDGPCNYIYELTRTWTATDNCGNSAVESQKITVEDNTPPVINGVPSDITVECDDIPAASINVVATDNCTGNVEMTFAEYQVVGVCGNSYELTRTWTATDDCGNSSVGIQVISVIDETAPVLMNVPADVTVECDSVPSISTNVSGTDSCDSDVEVSVIETIVEGSCDASYSLVRTWTGTDNCGNSTVETQTIFVHDTTNPILYDVPDDITVSCNNIPAVPIVSATDNCNPNMEISFTEIGNCSDGIITRQWTVADDCGNSSVGTQVISIGTNANPITLINLPNDVTVECDAIPSPPNNVQGTTTCDSEVSIAYAENTTIGSCQGNFVIARIFTGTDTCGNSISDTSYVTVENTTAPVLINVPSDVTVSCSNIPSIPNVTAEDNCGFGNSIEVIFSETQDGDCETITRTWSATDDCGNNSVGTQVITIGTNANPITLINLPNDVTVACDAIPSPPNNVQGTTTCDSEVSIAYAENTTIGSCQGNFVIARIFTGTDTCGNSLSDTSYVTVENTTAPVLINVPSDVTVSCSNIPSVANVTAEDNCGFGNSIEVIFSETQDGDCETITRTWSATDDCGNNSVATQVITINSEAPNTIEPQLTLSENDPDLYTFFTLSVSVTNNGNETIPTIYMPISIAEGSVLEGGNEYEIDPGGNFYFGYPNTEVYYLVENLAPGATHHLDIHLYNLVADPKTYNISVQTPADLDINASITTGDAINLPELFSTNLSSVAIGAPGDVVTCSFDLNNSGTIPSEGDYTIGGYLSTDNTLSSNDVLVANVFTGNTPKGTIPDVLANINIPSDFTPGNYYFILNVDIDNQVEEQYEDNNISSIPFTVTGDAPDICNGDVTLTTQAEVNAFDCTQIQGNLVIKGNDIINISPLTVLTKVNGEVRIESTKITNVQGLNNLQSAKNLIVAYNSELKNLDGLVSLSGSLEELAVVDNDKMTDFNQIQNVAVTKSAVIQANDKMNSIDGLLSTTNLSEYLDVSGMTQLKNVLGLANLQSINEGNITTNGIISLEGLHNLMNVTGNLIISDNFKLASVNGIGGLTNVGGLVVSNNIKLANLNGLSGLTRVEDLLVISANDNLFDLCGLYNLASVGEINGTVEIQNNASNPTISDIASNCVPSENGSDLALTMQIDNADADAFTFFSVSVTVSNSGTESANSVKVHIPIPDGAVLEGGNEYEDIIGVYDTWQTFIWSVEPIEPGQSTTIHLNLFRLTSESVDFYAEVIQNLTDDVDSTPGNGTPPLVNEDDEVTASLNPVAQGRFIPSKIVLSENGKTLLELEYQTTDVDDLVESNYLITPNPVRDVLTLLSESKIDESKQILIYDIFGKVVQKEDTFDGKRQIDVSRLNGGVYHLIIGKQVLRFVKLD